MSLSFAIVPSFCPSPCSFSARFLTMTSLPFSSPKLSHVLPLKANFSNWAIWRHPSALHLPIYCSVFSPAFSFETYLPTYSMLESPSWEANRFATSQEIPRILCNPKVHCHVYNCPPPVPILSQIDPVHAQTSHILKIVFDTVLPSKPESSKWSLFFGFPHHNHVCTSSFPVRATRPAHPTRIIMDEQYSSLSSSLCSFLHSLVTWSLLDPNILLSTLLSNSQHPTLKLPQPTFCLNVSDHVSHPYKTTDKTVFLYNIIFKFVDSKLEDKGFCTKW